MAEIQQVRKGSSPLIILSILNNGPLHGYGIMHELEARSEGYFKMTAALLYPTLHQMEQEKLVEAVWEDTPGQRRKKVYSITKQGRSYLSKTRLDWEQFFKQLFSIVNRPQENGSSK